MPASYGTSGATNNINAEVISRFLFGSVILPRLFLVPVIPSGGTDITNRIQQEITFCHVEDIAIIL